MREKIPADSLPRLDGKILWPGPHGSCEHPDPHTHIEGGLRRIYGENLAAAIRDYSRSVQERAEQGSGYPDPAKLQDAVGSTDE